MIHDIKSYSSNVKLIIASVLVLSSLFARMVGACESQDRRLVQVMGGSMLVALYCGQVKELAFSRNFYGYGWLDEKRVFIAYQDNKFAEAAAVMKVLDLSAMWHTDLGELGGAGETNFNVNTATSEVVYSDMGGVKLIKIDDDNSYKGAKISDKTCYGVFWISNDKVACVVSAKDELSIETIHKEGVIWGAKNTLPTKYNSGKPGNSEDSIPISID